jgi:UDP:flavonoid glycosyltransferase YjiC (YdhE family)
MKIVAVTYGSRGDVQPILSLALALQSAGHSVRMVGPPENANWVQRCGCSFSGLGTNVDAFLSSCPNAHGIKSSLFFNRFLRREIENQFSQLPDLIRNAELVLGASLVLGLPTVAEFMNIPYRFIAFAPQVLPSSRHPSPLVRSQRLPSWLNRLSWSAVRSLDRFNLRSIVNNKRRELGLKLTKDWWTDLIGNNVIVASDPVLAAVPPDVRQVYTQTGYFHLGQKGEISKEVKGFLADGPPPVYFGFGSMPRKDQSALRPLLLASARLAKQRVIISQLREDPTRLTGSVDSCFVNNLPHHLLFPKLALVVHHGGAGTTATAARAGVPQIIVPHILDQFYWADRVHALGLGPKPIWRSKLTVKRLKAAIMEAVSNQRFRQQARDISQILRKQDSLGDAIRLIESESFLKADNQS